MTTRATQRDTAADLELYRCLTSSPPRSFLMVAGAGSGKTTSLIKGLTKVLSNYGDTLKRRRQRVACITYTEIAAGEIWADVGNNPLVNVSTIHSFLWSVVRPFQSDIQQWVASRIEQKVTELRNLAINFGPRVQQRTRDKNAADIARYQQQRERIERVNSFGYGTGSDYVNGILGHDDIIKLASQLIVDRPLMRTLLAQQYPFLFVDESQDTMESVVLALRSIADDLQGKFCLGFFGDPMQQIYATGIGTIPMGANWAQISKPENFRCPTAVLDVANAIRRDGDGLIQTRGRMEGPENAQVSVSGSANLFILPSAKRDELLAQVRSWAARQTGDPNWTEDDEESVKVLVIVHRMAANKLGFGDLYVAMNDKAPEKFRNGFLDGTSWPLRPFKNFVLPLVSAVSEGNEFEAMQILRVASPLLRPEKLTGINVAERLAKLRQFTLDLQAMMAPGSTSTVADVLIQIHQSKVIDLDERVVSYLALPTPVAAVDDNAGAGDGELHEEIEKEVAAMDAFLACRATQLLGYYKYVNDESPFSTHQGIKGAEFDRVLVVIDDDEGTHVQFSYEKYFGIKPLSDRDEENIREGRPTTVDRTRRLFYVCCTRALKDLVVVLFTANVGIARDRMVASGLFKPGMIHIESDLAASPPTD
jgi:DNA helicase II / ATP-dependent DNA helicase PcrA